MPIQRYESGKKAATPPDKVFVIKWSGSISWNGSSAEDAIKDFKRNQSFPTFMREFSHFEESRWNK